MASSVPQKKPNFYGGNVFEDSRKPDPLVNELCHFMYEHLVRRKADNLEIEAKLGFLVNSNTDRRLRIGAKNRVLFPSIQELRSIEDAPLMHFQSGVTKDQFARLNALLNNRVGHTAARTPGPGGRPIPPMLYSRAHETDRFYESGEGRVRVSVNEEGRVLRAIVKRRISDVNIHCPSAPFDLRVSASMETPARAPSGRCSSLRRKHRLSYRFDVWSIDITTVKTFTAVGEDNEPADEQKHTLSYEVEVELREEYTAFVRDEFTKAWANKPSVAPRLAESLLNNLQTLSLLCHPASSVPALARPPGGGGGGGGRRPPPDGQAKRARGEPDADAQAKRPRAE